MLAPALPGILCVMQPHETIWNLTTAFVAARALQTVAELGVADHVGDGHVPVPVEELARACGADPDALERVLRLLETQGIFAVGCAGVAHTPSSRLLRSDHPMSMRAFARMMGSPGILATFDRFDHSVRTGAPAAERLPGGNLWAYLQANPDEARVFGEAMTAKAGADIAAVLGSYDFSRFARVADIGGGRGHLLRAVLDAAPSAHGVLFDLPHVVDALEIGRDRIDTVAGDFFVDPLPAAEGYLLMDVIHDWADAEAAAILRAVRRAAPSGARVLIVENVLADEGSDPHGRTLDAIMLAVTGGRERTGAQLTALLTGAGFGPVRLIDTPGPLRIVEATAP